MNKAHDLIAEEWNAGNKNKTKLGEKFGVSARTVGRIVGTIQREMGGVFGEDILGLRTKDAVDHLCIKDTGSFKILGMSDFHIPFQLTKQIKQTIVANADAKYIAIHGDFLDAFAISQFYKDPVLEKNMRKMVLEYFSKYPDIAEFFSYQVSPIICEVVTGQLLLKFIKENTDAKIIICAGNHEDRLKKYIFKEDVMAMLHITSDNILDYYKGTPGVTIVNHWHFSINDTSFCHPHSYSRAYGKTAVDTMNYLIDNHEHDTEQNVFVVGHTHNSSCGRVRGRLVMEPGCLCGDLDYADRGRLLANVPSNGYSLVYQNGGLTDYDKSRCVFL